MDHIRRKVLKGKNQKIDANFNDQNVDKAGHKKLKNDAKMCEKW